MTRQRNDGHSTEFGLWLRSVPELDSYKGYRSTNVDFHWTNIETGKWLFIEEKRHGKCIPKWQSDSFRMIHRWCRCDVLYHGFWLLQFENTSPKDGWMKLNGKQIDAQTLIKFLEFSFPRSEYMKRSLFV